MAKDKCRVCERLEARIAELESELEVADSINGDLLEAIRDAGILLDEAADGLANALPGVDE